MKLEKAKKQNIEKIVSISKRAFETDVEVGGVTGDGPPDYDSISWHEQMRKEGHLYQATVENTIVGGAVLFLSEDEEKLYIGRIFIDRMHQKKGYGLCLMELIENLYPNVKEINLDTPCWNVRTNSFYQKLNYKELKQEDDFVFYQKQRNIER